MNLEEISRCYVSLIGTMLTIEPKAMKKDTVRFCIMSSGGTSDDCIEIVGAMIGVGNVVEDGDGLRLTKQGRGVAIMARVLTLEAAKGKPVPSADELYQYKGHPCCSVEGHEAMRLDGWANCYRCKAKLANGEG